MSDRSSAISILQRARDLLSERLTERIVEAQQEIEADAEGASYLSEIEAIYEQLGSRLAHVSAMLSHLPPAIPSTAADVIASEIIYADLASSYSTPLDAETSIPHTLLALPAPASFEKRAGLDVSSDEFAELASRIELGDLSGASRVISDLFDIKPSQSRRWVMALVQQLSEDAALTRRLAGLGREIQIGERAAAELLARCFDLPPAEAQAMACAIRSRLGHSDKP